MRTMSAEPDWNATARRNGNVTLPTSWHASSRPWSPTIQCWGEATSRSSTRCRRILGQVTTAMPSEADFACGEKGTLSRPPARVPNNGLEDQKGCRDDRTTRDLASAFDQQANGMAGPRTPPQDNAGLAPAKAVRR